MVTNNRQMGTNGFWYGIEVERTQFYGLETVFFSRAEWFLNRPDVIGDRPHIFLDEDVKDFYRHVDLTHFEFVREVEIFLEMGKKVTVSVSDPCVSYAQGWHSLRKRYPQQFCLLVTVVLPEPEVGAFAIKVVPPVVFEDRENESGVYTCTFDQFRFTGWSEYDGDVDGK